MATIFHKSISNELYVSYDTVRQAPVITLYERSAGATKTASITIIEPEWEELKKFMEQVYP